MKKKKGHKLDVFFLSFVAVGVGLVVFSGLQVRRCFSGKNDGPVHFVADAGPEPTMETSTAKLFTVRSGGGEVGYCTAGTADGHPCFDCYSLRCPDSALCKVPILAYVSEAAFDPGMNGARDAGFLTPAPLEEPRICP